VHDFGDAVFILRELRVFAQTDPHGTAAHYGKHLRLSARRDDDACANCAQVAKSKLLPILGCLSQFEPILRPPKVFNMQGSKKL
jgi:hypothetical protein